MMTSPPPVLLFVPGFTPIDGNNATRIAQVIASSQSRQRAGSYSVKLDSGDAGSERVASIVDSNGDVVLTVIEVDYRPRLAEVPSGQGARSWALLRSGRFALLGIIRLLAARQRSKTGRHRWFLLAGFMLVLLMIGAFALLALAALAAAGVDRLRWFAPPESNQLAWGAGLASAAGVLYWLRTRVLEGGQRVRELVRYLERDREAASVALALDVEIDRVLDRHPSPPAIHILAYSFGSIVALDALFPRVPRRAKGGDRVGTAVTSLVTVGCPVDFVRQFYPTYLEGRTPRRADLPWTNVFLPEDLLGSNFLDDDDHSGFESPPAGDDVFAIAGVRPSRSLAVGRERLTLKSLLSLEGVRIHGEYWDQAHRANLLEPVIDTWVPSDRPADGARPAA
jgi:hypothetical protein